AVGPLRLHHALILAEDRPLEGLDHVVGMLEVVVAGHHAVAHAAVARHRLRGGAIDEAVGAAPVDVLDDRVGQAQRVARTPPPAPAGRPALARPAAGAPAAPAPPTRSRSAPAPWRRRPAPAPAPAWDRRAGEWPRTRRRRGSASRGTRRRARRPPRSRARAPCRGGRRRRETRAARRARRATARAARRAAWWRAVRARRRRRRPRDASTREGRRHVRAGQWTRRSVRYNICAMRIVFPDGAG